MTWNGDFEWRVCGKKCQWLRWETQTWGPRKVTNSMGKKEKKSQMRAKPPDRGRSLVERNDNREMNFVGKMMATLRTVKLKRYSSRIVQKAADYTDENLEERWESAYVGWRKTKEVDEITQGENVDRQAKRM